MSFYLCNSSARNRPKSLNGQQRMLPTLLIPVTAVFENKQTHAVRMHFCDQPDIALQAFRTESKQKPDVPAVATNVPDLRARRNFIQLVLFKQLDKIVALFVQRLVTETQKYQAVKVVSAPYRNSDAWSVCRQEGPTNQPGKKQNIATFASTDRSRQTGRSRHSIQTVA